MYRNQHEKLATACAESILYGEDSVIRRYEINPRTLKRWRDHVKKSPELTNFVEKLLDSARAEWQKRNADTALSVIAGIQRSIEALDPSEPETLKILVSAYRAVGEMAVASKITGGVDDNGDEKCGMGEEADGTA